MKKLLIIPLFFFSISVFGQFTKNQLYNGINLNIRNKGASQLRLANMLDSIVVSMGSGGGSMVYPSAGLAKSTGSAWGTSITAGAGVETWLTTPSWTNFNSAITGTAPFWKLGGNASTVDGTDFIGTTDNIPFNIRVNNNMAGRIESSSTANTFYGYQTGISANTDNVNTGFGFQVMGSTTGGENTGVGFNALFTNTTGASNTAIGKNSLRLNLSGNDNTAVGVSALSKNSTAIGNTAVGRSTLGNATAGYNTAIGGGSLSVVTTGTYNTAIGYGANVSSGSLTNATAIGNGATVTASNTVQIGNASVTTINMGTSTTAKVVSGGLQITGGTLSSGNVLTSDASGNASWAAPSGGGLTVGASTITSGTNTKVLYNNSGVLGEYTVSGSGNVAMTTSPTFTTPVLGTVASGSILTNATGLPPTTGISGWPSNASGVLTNNGSGTLTWGAGGGGWATTGTTTLTGAATIAGSTTNTLTFQTPSLGTTYSSSYIFENPTAATSGNQQISPPKVERGYGWKTTATAASQPVEVSTYVLPVQGSTNPSLKYRWNYSINGAAPTTFMEYTNVGDALTLPSNITFPGNGFLLSGSTSPLYIGNGNGTTMSNAVIIRNQNNNSNTSGTPNLLSIGGGRSFAPTSGTAVFSSSVIDMTINQTGTSSGDVYGYSVANTITSAKANTYGFYYSPSVTTIAGTEYAFNSTRGKVLINGTTITANTLFDVRGTGTTTNLIQRWADSGNTERLAIQDNGVILVGTDAGTAGQVLTSQGSGAAATWQTPVIKTTATQSATETLVVSYGNLTSSASASSSIYTNAYYSNSTVLIADFTVYAIKSDGSSSAVGKVTGRYRKNSSGTFSVDDAGTAVISDTAILASLVPEINGTNPQLLTTMGATSGTYRVSFTAVLNYTNY